jgi:hypothetical protein
MNTHVRGRDLHARRTFIEVSPELRHLLEAIAQAAIDALDQIDGEPDLEDGADSEPDNDGEPTLGWTEDLWFGEGDDREEECEDEGAQCDDEGDDSGDREPWLGWHDVTGSHGGTISSAQGLEG